MNKAKKDTAKKQVKHAGAKKVKKAGVKRTLRRRMQNKNAKKGHVVAPKHNKAKRANKKAHTAKTLSAPAE